VSIVEFEDLCLASVASPWPPAGATSPRDCRQVSSVAGCQLTGPSADDRSAPPRKTRVKNIAVVVAVISIRMPSDSAGCADHPGPGAYGRM
jgi:hypothetical protein